MNRKNEGVAVKMALRIGGGDTDRHTHSGVVASKGVLLVLHAFFLFFLLHNQAEGVLSFTTHTKSVQQKFCKSTVSVKNTAGQQPLLLLCYIAKIKILFHIENTESQHHPTPPPSLQITSHAA